MPNAAAHKLGAALAVGVMTAAGTRKCDKTIEKTAAHSLTGQWNNRH